MYDREEIYVNTQKTIEEELIELYSDQNTSSKRYD